MSQDMKRFLLLLASVGFIAKIAISVGSYHQRQRELEAQERSRALQASYYSLETPPQLDEQSAREVRLALLSALEASRATSNPALQTDRFGDELSGDRYGTNHGDVDPDLAAGYERLIREESSSFLR